METKVKIEISNRHVHLTKETYELLFDEKLTKVKDLSQKGEFASNQKVTLTIGDKQIDGVRIIGPFRSYNQVEISHKDALGLGINPPVRASGNLDGAAQIIVKTPKASVVVNGCIIAQRHVHLSPEDAKRLGLGDKQKVTLKIDGDKSGTMDVYTKVSDNGAFFVHIDTDDANCFLINSLDEGTLIY